MIIKELNQLALIDLEIFNEEMGMEILINDGRIVGMEDKSE
jgi:hypothetical protein